MKKNYLIYGLAKSGISALNLLYNQKDDFYLFDDDENIRNKEIEKNKDKLNVYVLKCVDNDILSTIDLIIISPAVSIYNPIIENAKSKHIKVISELELGFQYCRNKMIAITGTNGKTTTVRLIHDIIKKSHRKVEMIGNIGNPITARVKKKGIFVCEVSSFQLEAISSFEPSYAGILNITPDHLNRHKNFEIYKNTKFFIFKNMRPKSKIVLNLNIKYHNNKFDIYRFGFLKNFNDLTIKRNKNLNLQNKKEKNNKRLNKENYDCFCNFNDSNLKLGDDIIKIMNLNNKFNLKKGCFCINNDIIFSNGKKIEKICCRSDIFLLGNHNVENVLASIIFAKFLKIKNKYIINAIKNFKLSPHRMEKVFERNGICFFDDSKATNIDSTLRAIESMDKDTILILGGSDKGYDFNDVFKELNEKIILVLATGEVKEKILNSATKFNKEVIIFEKLKDATNYALNILKPGQNLLLSPSCASFDEFKSYKERGEKFLSYIKDFYENKTK